jgi:hypothetical protein
MSEHIFHLADLLAVRRLFASIKLARLGKMRP